MGISYKRKRRENIHRSCGRRNRDIRSKYLLTVVCVFTVYGNRIPVRLQEGMSKSADEVHGEGGIIPGLTQKSVK